MEMISDVGVIDARFARLKRCPGRSRQDSSWTETGPHATQHSSPGTVETGTDGHMTLLHKSSPPSSPSHITALNHYGHSTNRLMRRPSTYSAPISTPLLSVNQPSLQTQAGISRTLSALYPAQNQRHDSMFRILSHPSSESLSPSAKERRNGGMKLQIWLPSRTSQKATR